MTNPTTTRNEPIIRLRHGMLQLAIWKNEREQGRPFYSTSPVQRCYKDDAGNYQETTSLNSTQLLQAARLHVLAYDRIRDLEDADYQASKA